MHSYSLVCINQYTKFEVPSFTNYKDMIGAKFNKKLSYCRGTALCVMLVNSCYVSRGMGARKVSNSKSDLQGHLEHWLRCTVIERWSLTGELSLSHARPVADG